MGVYREGRSVVDPRFISEKQKEKTSTPRKGSDAMLCICKISVFGVSADDIFVF